MFLMFLKPMNASFDDLVSVWSKPVRADFLQKFKKPPRSRDALADRTACFDTEHFSFTSASRVSLTVIQTLNIPIGLTVLSHTANCSYMKQIPGKILIQDKQQPRKNCLHSVRCAGELTVLIVTEANYFFCQAFASTIKIVTIPCNFLVIFTARSIGAWSEPIKQV
jgi:hypothetical protein